MSEVLFVQYVGFENKGAVRDYTFTFRGSGGKSSEYFVTIANAAFLAHRVRYQDGPEICSLLLHREFAVRSDHPPSTCFSVTDAELAEYMTAHLPKPKTGPHLPKIRDGDISFCERGVAPPDPNEVVVGGMRSFTDEARATEPMF